MLRKLFYHNMTPQLRCPSGFFGSSVATRFLNLISHCIIKESIQILEPQPHDKILDIGFGGGKSLSILLRKNATLQLYGVEPSQAALKHARKKFRLAIQSQRLLLKEGAVSQLDFPENFFDKVMSINTIYFWTNPQADIQEIKRVLAAGGRIVIAHRSKKSMQQRPFQNYGYQLYEAQEVINLLKQAGFQAINYYVGKSIGLLDSHIITAIKASN